MEFQKHGLLFLELLLDFAKNEYLNTGLLEKIAESFEELHVKEPGLFN